jgi:hypothetical protein
MKHIKEDTLPIQNYFRFARSIFGEDLLENFLVSAVASVLAIRLYLSLTEYPIIQIGGGGGLHLAHMLWGGLLMLISMFMLLGFLSRPAHEIAAVLGGIGFGTFIDELGKFITLDNNYFYKPTAAIIYVTFILIYLAIRFIFNRRPLRPHEKLANAFEIMKQASINGLDSRDEEMMKDLLKDGDTDNSLIVKLKEMLSSARIVPLRRPHPMNRIKNKLDGLYQKLVSRWWFAGVVIAFFAFTAITGFSSIARLINWPWNLISGIAAAAIILLALLQFWESRIPNLQIPLSGGIILVSVLILWLIVINRGNGILQLAEWAQIASSSLSAVLIVAGIVFTARSRLIAYQMYQRATLVSILLTQVFAFYQYQFYALISVFLDILILSALRYMIHREQTREQYI